MSNLITKDYHGIAVQFTGEAWFNATAVAKKFGKEPFDWLNQRDTVEYMCALGRRMSDTLFLQEFSEIKVLDGASASSRAKLLRLAKKTGLVRTKTGSMENGGGTWLHPKLGVLFARWLDMEFSLWCDEQITSIISEESKTNQQPFPQAKDPHTQALIQALLVADQAKQEADQAKQKAEEARKEAEKANRRLDQMETATDYFTVVAYARHVLKQPIPLAEASRLGKAASNICRAMGISMGASPCQRFGKVNTYPKSVLDEVVFGRKH